MRRLVYVDTDSGAISKLFIRAVDLPADFRIKENNAIIDYGSVNVGGRFYTLPLKALIFVHSSTQYNRNEISFVKYRKFEAESIFTSTESKIKYKLPSEK